MLIPVQTFLHIGKECKRKLQTWGQKYDSYIIHINKNENCGHTSLICERLQRETRTTTAQRLQMHECQKQGLLAASVEGPTKNLKGALRHHQGSAAQSLRHHRERAAHGSAELRRGNKVRERNSTRYSLSE